MLLSASKLNFFILFYLTLDVRTQLGQNSQQCFSFYVPATTNKGQIAATEIPRPLPVQSHVFPRPLPPIHPLLPSLTTTAMMSVFVLVLAGAVLSLLTSLTGS